MDDAPVVWILTVTADGFSIHHKMDTTYPTYNEAIRSGFRVLKLIAIDRSLDDPMYSMRNYTLSLHTGEEDGMLLECGEAGWACFVPGVQHEADITSVYTELTGNIILPSKSIPEA